MADIRMRPGPRPTYDPVTRAARKREQQNRANMVLRRLVLRLQEKHPKIHDALRAEIEDEITQQLGPLPGDPTPSRRKR